VKRDMDLVRSILLSVEQADDSYLDSAQLAGESWDPEVVARHVGMMVDAGLLTGELTEFCGGGADAYVNGITWVGYDFLDSVRDDDVWRETRESIGKSVGTASFEVVKALATHLAMKALGL
jgi:Hypothetical protein (DUF2513)